MVEVKEKCNCISKLMNLGIVQYYCPPYNVIDNNYEEVDEGTLCLVQNEMNDNGTWNDNYEWISSIELINNLIPIEYCPICGKKIEYKKIKGLTKKY